MDTNMPAREDALALLKEFNSNESLIKHALAVEGVMRYIAKKKVGRLRQMGNCWIYTRS